METDEGGSTPLDLLRSYRDRMIETVSPNDRMILTADVIESNAAAVNDWCEQYFWVTEESLRIVVKAMLAAEKSGFQRILDLPCGHGRALRAFRAAFPDAELTACDIDRDGVDFCARTFGARPVYSDPDPRRIDLGEDRFDLIYVGSLLTHLDEAPFRAFLDLFSRHLAPNGILVFTTHGRWCVTYHKTVLPFIGPEAWAVIERGYDADGFGYHDYAESPGYGITLTSPAWVLDALEADRSLTLVFAQEKGLGNYQDVFAVLKNPIDNIHGPMMPRHRPTIYQGTTEMDGAPRVSRGPRTGDGLSPELRDAVGSPLGLCSEIVVPASARSAPALLRRVARRLLGR